jgi:hypothetical protein
MILVIVESYHPLLRCRCKSGSRVVAEIEVAGSVKYESNRYI